MDRSRTKATWRAIALLTVALLGLTILWSSQQRTSFGRGAESDFTDHFGPEAQRILSGEPLLLSAHPPGYAFALALAHTVAGSWMASGLWISGISAMLVLFASLIAFERLAGPLAGIGALAACACSLPFLQSASSASSDMMFAALFVLALVLAIEATRARARLHLWVLTGFVAALALLARTNGLAAAGVLVAPMLAAADWRGRARSVTAVLTGFLAPLSAWAIYARASDSLFMPGDTYVWLAAAAYSDGRGESAEEASLMASRFGDIVQVLTYDPVHMMRQFGARLLALPYDLVAHLTWTPIALLAIVGALVLMWQRRSREWLVCLLLVACLVGFTFIHAFQERFYLMLVPIAGALAGVAVARADARLALRPTLRAALLGVFALALALVAWRTHAQVLPALETPYQAEMNEAIPQVLQNTEPDALIISRKTNLGFETDRESEILPEVRSVAALHTELCAELTPDDHVYLYLGSAERHYRPEFVANLLAAEPVPWLKPLATGTKADWKLWRITLFEASLPSASRCPQT